MHKLAERLKKLRELNNVSQNALSKELKVTRATVNAWERAMAEVGHKRVMTSTQSDEFAQHFYQHMGYCVIGGFLMGDDPYEVILVKDIG